MMNSKMNLKANLASEYIFFVFFLLFCTDIFSQKLTGTYLDALPGSIQVTSITFIENSKFEYSTGSDTGNIDFGKGDFVITDNTLTLFFSNDLPLKEYGSHSVHYWKSLNDSISVHFELSSNNISPIAKTHIIVFNGDILLEGVSIPEGEKKVKIKLPKVEGNNFYKAIINRIGYEPYVFYFQSNFNQEIQFNIIKTDYEFGLPIINEVLKFDVLQTTDTLIKVRDQSGKIINWSKNE